MPISSLTISLKHLKPGDVTALFADDGISILPDGIETLTLNLKRNAIGFAGTPEALEQARELVRLLDVPARTAPLTFKIVQGAKSVEKTVRVRNNKRVHLAEPGRYSFDVTPHFNRNNSISVLVESPSEKLFKVLQVNQSESLRFKDCVV
jgi:type II secretory pathway component GspD/PulD (secretin)